MATAEIVQPIGYAEYGQRVRSAIVDALLIGFAVGALVFGLSVFAARGGPFANLLNTIAYLIYLAGATVYYTVCYAEGGQTIGKLTTARRSGSTATRIAPSGTCARSSALSSRLSSGC
jgi:hypothetical protein